MNNHILLGLILMPCITYAMEDESQIIESTLNNAVTYIRFGRTYTERAEYNRGTKTYTSSRCISADTPIGLFEALEKAYKEQEAKKDDGASVYTRGYQLEYSYMAYSYIRPMHYKDEAMRSRGSRYLVEDERGGDKK